MTTPVNPIENRPIEPILAELSAKGFDPVGPFAIAIRDLVTRADKTANNNGEIHSRANISNRTEPLSSTLQNVTSAGAFNSLANVVDTNTDHLTDGTGSPLTGGKRGFQALDNNNRLANSFRENPVNVMAISTSAAALSNDGVSTAITVGASTVQYGAGQISYNAGSVDPGGFGTFFIYASDPTFSGGAVTYLSSQNVQDTAAGDGLIFFGKITTQSGSSKTGGGNSGGTTPGGFGGNRGA